MSRPRRCLRCQCAELKVHRTALPPREPLSAPAAVPWSPRTLTQPASTVSVPSRQISTLPDVMVPRRSIVGRPYCEMGSPTATTNAVAVPARRFHRTTAGGSPVVVAANPATRPLWIDVPSGKLYPAGALSAYLAPSGAHM